MSDKKMVTIIVRNSGKDVIIGVLPEDRVGALMAFVEEQSKSATAKITG